MEKIFCSICDGLCVPFDVMDFNRSGKAEIMGEFRPLLGIPVYYYLCDKCGFCFAPEFGKWTMKDFAEKIYNEEYIEVDPEFKIKRPTDNANNLLNIFKGMGGDIRHIDYGGGTGLLCELTKEKGWNSLSYDPFVDRKKRVEETGRFNLITAFEVFEHVSDVNSLMSEMLSLLDNDGIILFSTLLSDGFIMKNQRLSWWYASPRNGHISLFSKNSLNILAQKNKFHFGSFNPGFHILYKAVPDWARHLFSKN